MAGVVWLAAGGAGVAWIASLIGHRRWTWPWTVKTGSPEEREVFRIWGRIGTVIVAWLGLYLVLDWFF